MKIDAVSQPSALIAARGDRRDALDQRLVSFLRVAGCLAVPVPNTFDSAADHGKLPDGSLALWLQAVAPAAIVLSGGNDLGACPERDLTESRLLDHARQHRLPALGICRGMQMMAVWAGAALKPVAGHVRSRHQLRGSITGEANSYHNQVLAGCPADFSLLARSEDGEIEAIGHRTLPWEGWMWHPERETRFAKRDIERLKALFA